MSSAEQVLKNTAARIADADQEAHKAEIAFAAGKFPEYFSQTAANIEASIQDEHDKLFGQAADR